MAAGTHTQLTRLLVLAGAGALVLSAPSAAAAETPGASSHTSAGGEAGTSASEAPATSAPTLTVEPPPPPPPPAARTRAPRSSSAPHVHAQHAQGVTRAAPGPAPAKARSRAPSKPSPTAAHRSGPRAPQPSSITPALPLAFSASLAGIPTFFIESFRIPPFLLPIFQAAGTAYGVPWQVLAAINEVETDYGRDLSVSSAGAEGWMQFLPSSWAIYGVDATGNGFKDPYNPADAIFAAARYLRAAGAATDLRGAIYAYNHSQAYVETVLLRARLLGGTPNELLGALAGLTQARFPVHAPSHFSDGFPPSPTGAGRTLPGTTIYSQAGAPVIAVQDGQVARLGDTRELGRFVTLRDAYGNTYTYAELGTLARFYPVLQPHESARASSTRARPTESAEPAPTAPATAGVQPSAQAPLEEGTAIAGLGASALGGGLGAAPATSSTAGAPSAHAAPTRASSAATSTPSAFRAGPNDVYLHPLRAGVRVIAGTVLGHVGAGGDEGPHMLFQIRPVGSGAPLIDPKPILDGWVQLENTQVTRAGGGAAPTSEPGPGQVLLESKQQLQDQLLSGREAHLQRCARQDVQTGKVDRRVLAAIEFLASSGLPPSVSGLPCAIGGEAKPLPAGSGQAFDISAVAGIPVAGHEGPGSIAEAAIRKLLSLQGPLKPRQLVSATSYAGASGAVAAPGYAGRIHISFVAPASPPGRIAATFGTAIAPNQWVQLIARLGEIPSPIVRSGHSAASIPDQPASTGAPGGNG